VSAHDPGADPTESLAALPSASPAVNGAAAPATCAGCGVALAADQRYCLACGRPASPVRLAFLDVLQGEPRDAGHGAGTVPRVLAPGAAYAAALPPEPDGLLGALRRYSGLLALLGVLLAALLIGLLVGHWITGGGSSGSAPAKQVVEVKGLGGLPLAAAAAGTTAASANQAGAGGGGGGAGARSEGGSEHVSAKQEAKEVKEVAAAKAPPAVHKKASAKSLQKLGKTTGKQHVKEVNELIKGDEPIETGH
jgi:hypothetical protein